jgi:hypothetical protein
VGLWVSVRAASFSGSFWLKKWGRARWKHYFMVCQTNINKNLESCTVADSQSGMYTVLFWHCIYILRRKAKSTTTTPNQTLFVSAIVMYVLATGLIITDFARGFAAFILHGGTLDGPTNYFEQFWIWSNLVRESLFVTMV